MDDQRAQIRQAEREEQDDITELMSLPAFQRFSRRVLEETAVFRTSFTAGDPHATSFNEGRRNTGLWLIAQLTPDELALVMKE